MGGAQRISVGAVAPTITATFRDGHGMPVAPGATVTVGVDDWAGVEVLAPLTATTSPQTGVYQVALPTPTAATQLTATWTAGSASIVTTVDVVGGRLVWPEEFTSSPGVGFAGRSSIEISDAIAWFEDLAYRYLNWSPIVRFASRTLRGCGTFSGAFSLPDPFVTDLLGVTWHSTGVPDVVATAGELALFEVTDAGLLYGSYVTTKATVAYTHGDPSGAADLHDAALTAIRLHLLENSAGRPTLSVANDLGGVTRFSVAGEDKPTGIPEVDAVLNGLRFPVCA
ncbi:MAG TPA: hypothetical protein VMZ73_09025 [Acidimicrobiales bacterium]|nr:hypothetical protein [Acidimicrobiales bacterium]